jgi:hypothetical protein
MSELGANNSHNIAWHIKLEKWFIQFKHVFAKAVLFVFFWIEESSQTNDMKEQNTDTHLTNPTE